MEVKVDLKRLKAAVFGVDLTTVDDKIAVNELNYLRREINAIEAKLTKHLVDYYAMDTTKAFSQVAAALESNRLFRVQEGTKEGRFGKNYSPMFLHQKGSPNDADVGEAAKSLSRASDGTLWCEDRQLMCAGLIRNGWVLVPKELL